MARRALLIGIDTFDHAGITPLKAPVNDARRLAELLRRDDVGGFEVETVENCDATTLRRKVHAFFSKAGSKDQSVVYFSGHGDKDAEGNLYLNTSDTEPSMLEATALPASFMIRMAKNSPSRQTIFLFDCCYSGAIAAAFGEKRGGAELSRDNFSVEGAHGMAVITASASLEAAREEDKGSGTESLFLHHLICGIETGAADSAQSGLITLGNLFAYVRDQLRHQGAKQQPRSFFFGLDGTETLTLNPALSANPIPPELLERCIHDDWRERRLAVIEMEELTEKEPALAPNVVDHLKTLLVDPDDRVKNVLNGTIARLETQISPSPASQEAADSRSNTDRSRLRNDQIIFRYLVAYNIICPVLMAFTSIFFIEYLRHAEFYEDAAVLHFPGAYLLIFYFLALAAQAFSLILINFCKQKSSNLKIFSMRLDYIWKTQIFLLLLSAISLILIGRNESFEIILFIITCAIPSMFASLILVRLSYFLKKIVFEDTRPSS